MKTRAWLLTVNDDYYFTYLSKKLTDHRICAFDTRKAAREAKKKFENYQLKKYPFVGYSVHPFVLGE